MEATIIEKIFDGLLKSGAIGTVLAIMLWVNYKIGTKLISVIESNTKGFTEVKEGIKEVKIAVHRSSDVIENNSKVIEKNTSKIIKLEEVERARKFASGGHG